MSFGGVNGAGPQGAPIFGNQPGAAGAVQGQAGAPANGATPFFGASFDSVLAAVSRGEVPLNMAVAPSILGGPVASPNANISLLQAMTQGVQQNGTNGLGVRSGPAPATEGTAAVNIGSQNPVAGAITDSGSTLVVDSRQVMSVPGVSNPVQYTGN